MGTFTSLPMDIENILQHCVCLNIVTSKQWEKVINHGLLSFLSTNLGLVVIRNVCLRFCMVLPTVNICFLTMKNVLYSFCTNKRNLGKTIYNNDILLPMNIRMDQSHFMAPQPLRFAGIARSQTPHAEDPLLSAAQAAKSGVFEGRISNFKKKMG